jgi:cysteine-rich repeat protein
MRSFTFTLCFAVLVACSQGPEPLARPLGDPRAVLDPGEPDPVAVLVAQELAEFATLSIYADPLERALRQPRTVEARGEVTIERCAEVQLKLRNACTRLSAHEPSTICASQATFFYAHDVPRCAGRLIYSTAQSPAAALTPLFAFDLTGDPLGVLPDGCGNGVLEEGEDCDDGNHDAWDTCDPHCKSEPFSGCERVIQASYERAGLAVVDAAQWKAPRSHLMVNQGRAMHAMDAATCETAKSVATGVCNELAQTMPFVSSCTPSGELWTSSTGPACSLRLDVTFQRLDPSFGVYSTSLGGVLAFTIE